MVTRQLAAWGPRLTPPQPSLEDQEWQEVPQVGWGWAGDQGGGVGGGLASPVLVQGQRPSPLTIRSLPQPHTPGLPALPRPALPRPARVGPRNSHRPLLVSRRALHPLLQAAGGAGSGRGTQPV